MLLLDLRPQGLRLLFGIAGGLLARLLDLMELRVGDVQVRLERAEIGSRLRLLGPWLLWLLRRRSHLLAALARLRLHRLLLRWRHRRPALLGWHRSLCQSRGQNGERKQ